jgi:hypothetical protein
MCNLFSWLKHEDNGEILFCEDRDIMQGASPYGYIGHHAIMSKYFYLLDLDDPEVYSHRESFLYVPEALALAVNDGRLDDIILEGVHNMPEDFQAMVKFPVRFEKIEGRWKNMSIPSGKIMKDVFDFDVRIGDKVLLGEHVDHGNGKNWNACMDELVGTEATVSLRTKEYGNLYPGVEVEENEWFWRIENLQVLRDGEWIDPPKVWRTEEITRDLPYDWTDREEDL